MTGILITGGTGTFGNAFVPEILRYAKVTRVVVFSRDELKQAEMERRLADHSQACKLRFYLGDVRDPRRLELVMSQITHVVHAAALKRIEKCELDPIEAINTNVQGTANVIHAALRCATVSTERPGHMVALSTDKACNPVNLYGATKLTMERLVLAANNLSGGRMRFSVVRYGNIFGSRGSVVRTWQQMIAAGKRNLPVTDLGATRFFMRIDDAVELVRRQMFLDMDGLGKTHEIVYATTMPAYRLGDLLTVMGGGADVIGLGRHEKLHEEIIPGVRSNDARIMSREELREELRSLDATT